jgi:hypothetical protein
VVVSTSVFYRCSPLYIYLSTKTPLADKSILSYLPGRFYQVEHTPTRNELTGELAGFFFQHRRRKEKMSNTCTIDTNWKKTQKKFTVPTRINRQTRGTISTIWRRSPGARCITSVSFVLLLASMCGCTAAAAAAVTALPLGWADEIKRKLNKIIKKQTTPPNDFLVSIV